MEKPRRLLIRLTLFAVLALTLAACGNPPDATDTPQQPTSSSQLESPSAQTDTPPPSNTPSPAGSPTSEATPAEGNGELNTASLAPATDLGSYRSTMTIFAAGMDNGVEIQGTIEFLIEYTRRPLAQHIVISSQGFEDPEEAADTEMYYAGDMTYFKFGEDWIGMPADGAEPLDDAGLIAPDDLLGDTCGWNLKEETNYNDTPVHHWTLQHTDFAECVTAEKLANLGEISHASGDLYVTVDSNHIVHMDLLFEGQGLAMGVGSAEDRVEEGRIDFAFKMTDINQPFTIHVPEAALASNAMPEDIPLPGDAEEVNNIFGMITFLSPSTPEQVVDHFKTEMLAHGWTQVSADEFSGIHMLEYVKGSRKASLMISTDSDVGKTSALITLEGEQQILAAPG